MADIIEQFHFYHPATGEYVAGVTLDVDTETNEGYCVELYDDESSQSTPFGKEESAACLAKETYEAILNCMTAIFENFNNETDFWSEDDFWNVFSSHFQPGWFCYNSDSDVVETTKDDANKLFTFIAEWRTKPETETESSHPQIEGYTPDEETIFDDMDLAIQIANLTAAGCFHDNERFNLDETNGWPAYSVFENNLTGRVSLRHDQDHKYVHVEMECPKCKETSWVGDDEFFADHVVLTHEDGTKTAKKMPF